MLYGVYSWLRAAGVLAGVGVAMTVTLTVVDWVVVTGCGARRSGKGKISGLLLGTNIARMLGDNLSMY